jgi:hypothetical protein
MRFVASAPNLERLKFVLLAPKGADAHPAFRNAYCELDEHSEYLASMQRLRGRLYLEDGAIDASELSSDHRHIVPADVHSWHLLAVNRHGEISGFARYRPYSQSVSFNQLGVRHAALAQCDEWGHKLRASIESDIVGAFSRNLSYSEVGGWGLTEELRCTTAAIRIALATYALARIHGGSISIGTATLRHCSASILGRIGGRPISYRDVELPQYYDPQYKCMMRILRFDSEAPNPRYEAWIEAIREQLLDAHVVTTTPVRVPVWAGMPAEVARPRAARQERRAW